jgi:hypothetical protein
MRQLIVLVAVVAGLATAGTASAGGFAQIGVAPLPTGIESGESWSPNVTILQHGRTPLAGVTPTVTITHRETGVSKSFVGSPADENGVSRARVVFSQAGDWDVLVETDWWGEGRLTFGPVTIEDGPTAVPTTDSFPTVPVLVGVLVLALLALATLGARRRWRPMPAGR